MAPKSALALACSLAILACAPREIAPTAATGSGTSNAGATWVTGGTTVTFRSGPWKESSGESPRSASSYKVLHRIDGTTVSTAIESAHYARYFEHSPSVSPAEFIRLFTSESGKTLLIQEEIPNDCAPCTNHILVRLDSKELTHVYLDLPTQDPKPGHENTMDFDEPAEVVAITDSTVTYKHSYGKKKTSEFTKLPSAKRPTFPG